MPKGVYERNEKKPVEATAVEVQAVPAVEEIQPKKSSLKPLPKGINAVVEDGRHVMTDDGHPLCKECNHRQDMHHVWREVEHQGFERDMYGNKREANWTTKHKNFETPSNPCQHACKCWDYK